VVSCTASAVPLAAGKSTNRTKGKAMYLGQSIEAVTRPANDPSAVWEGVRGWRLVFWRVVLDPNGRPVWTLHGEGATQWYRYQPDATTARVTLMNHYRRKHVPLIAGGHMAPVSVTDAGKLLGMNGPPALDKLTEMLECPDPGHLQNYVRPKPVKEPKPAPAPKAPPTKLQLAEAKLAKARAKVAEWQDAERHARAKAREWQRRARRIEARAKKLTAQPAQSFDPPGGQTV
jgi:hypothetical protein